MYLPGHFTEDRVDVLAALILEHPFATLVTPAGGALVASHLPMLWDPKPAPFGTLTGHVARPNPHATVVPDGESLAMFLGPQGYVSPGWLPSKQEHGKVVPTWNYVAVHATGSLRLVDDVDWLRALVTRLTARHEAGMPTPWQVTDAPEAFLESVLRGIVGVEMPVRTLEGKWKLSQNRPPADVDGIIDGLERRGDPPARALAAAMRTGRR